MYKKLVFVKRIKKIGGRRYHKRAKTSYALFHRVNGRPNKNRRCFIHFHGGGAIMGSPEAFKAATSRYAFEADANIISVSYRLAPDGKAPLGIIDAYAGLKNVIEKPKKFGCDPKKIAMFGESGGGYIVAGVGMMLAERNESDSIVY